MTSPDGITWTARTAGAVSGWRSVCWSPELSLFVAVAYTGTDRVMTSPDGITWTARTAGAVSGWCSVCWSPELSLFVAVAYTGTNRVMTSNSLKHLNYMDEISTPTALANHPIVYPKADNKLYFQDGAGAEDEIVCIAETQTLTNKSINSDDNTITNIINADIKVAAAIDATKLADGSVSNAELQRINSLSSNAQTQLNGKAAAGSNSDITQLSGLSTDLSISQGGTSQSTEQAAIDALTSVSGATNEHVLTKDTATGNAIFKASGGGFADPMTTRGDIIIKNAGNNTTRLGVGTNNQMLKSDGTDIAWDNLTIDDDAVTYAKIQNVVNDERILGRISGADGIIEELTKSNVLTMLNVDDGADVTGSNAPQAHKNSHDPEDGSDALDTAAPVATGTSNAIGNSHSLSRANHVHETAVVADTSPVLGGDLDLSTYEILVDTSPNADVTASGMKGVFTNGNAGAVAFGDVCYMAADGDLEFADADAITTMPGLYMALGTINAAASGEWLIMGIARNDAWNWTVGAGTLGLIYVSTTGTTGNTLTQTAPLDQAI